MFSMDSTFIVNLGFTLLIAGIITYYVRQQLEATNHKITSMFSLVSTLTQELNILKSNSNMNWVSGTVNSNTYRDDNEDDNDNDNDNEDNGIIERLLGRIQLPYYFVNKIEDYNAILGQQQIENINATINKIINRDTHTDNIRDLVQVNVGKCVQWCNRHEIPVSSVFT